MGKVKKGQRAKIEKILDRMKYRMYQANIRFVSHDHEKLAETMRRIGINARRIFIELKGDVLKRKRKLIKSRIGLRRIK